MTSGIPSRSDIAQAESDIRAGMIFVPEGWCLLGDSRRRTFVRSFHIDRLLVTNREYERFVLETSVQPPPHWVDGTIPPEQADHPVVNVTWYEAAEYAQWAGKRLPVGREWEKAARGTDGREYPWGETFEAIRCNTLEAQTNGTTRCDRYPDGSSPYGALDMCGNAWEWALDTAPQLTTFRMARGGSWFYPHRFGRCASVNWLSPEYRLPDVGFRCVWSEYTPR